MAQGVAALQARHSWETLAGETMGLIGDLKPGRGWGRG
jgi:hypothetical protein